MDYIKIYNKLIDKWKNNIIEDNIYFEKHHIIPKCVGGSDDESNIIRLPARDHLIAHELLALSYPDNFSLNNAVIAMSMISDYTWKRKQISSRLFAYFREQSSKLQKGKFLSDEVRRKISESNKGGHPMRSKEAGENISKGKKGKPYGTRVLDTNTGKIYSTLTECAKDIGYCSSTIKYWITNIPERGFVMYEGDGYYVEHHGNKKVAKAVQGPDGSIYKSLKECSRKTKHDLRTLKRWIERNPEKGFKYQ